MHIRLLPFAAALVILTGCASHVPLNRDQIGQIGPGMSPTEVNAIVGKATASAEYDFTSRERQYHARYYQLRTGTSQTTSVVCTPTCIPILIDVPVFEQYVVVQEQPTLALVGWGTVEELSKNPDEKISSLMPDLKKAHEQFNKKK